MDDALPRTFPTRIDWWIALLLVLVGGGAGIALVREFLRSPAETWPGLVIFFAVTALVVVLCVPTRYTVTESELIIRSGVLRSAIPLESIERVYPTHNPLAGPAWSLSRLGIQYRKGRIGQLALISPREREEFLLVLRTRAGLRQVGGELVREPGA